jgi:hypothetical protein
MLESEVGANDRIDGFNFRSHTRHLPVGILSDSTNHHQMFGLGFRADFGCKNFGCVAMPALQASASTLNWCRTIQGARPATEAPVAFPIGKTLEHGRIPGVSLATRENESGGLM